jgi:para-nitrobenzyl esterase
LGSSSILKSEPKAKEVLRAYGIRQRGKRPGEAFTEALTDLVFRLPARRFAGAHCGRTHVYDFGWRSTAYDGTLGACHAIELPFVFNTLATVAGPRGLAGENPPQALADHMNQLWIAFATSGTVPWAEYSAENRRVYHPETGETSAELPMPAEHSPDHAT